MTAYDPGPNKYGPDFNNRPVVTSCQTCGAALAVLSRREWVDRADNKAAHFPVWHDHTPSGTPERIHDVEAFVTSEPVRDQVATALMGLVEEGKAFWCEQCQSYVDTRFTDKHVESHREGGQQSDGVRP